MKLKLAHVCIGSPDLAATERFYCETLGLTRKFDFYRAGRLYGFYLALSDETFIEVFEEKSTPADSPPLRHFCLETDDIDLVAKRLQEAGYAPSEKNLGTDQSWQIWVESPEGLRFEFHEYTENSAQHTGATCVANW